MTLYVLEAVQSGGGTYIIGVYDSEQLASEASEIEMVKNKEYNFGVITEIRLNDLPSK